MTQLQQPSKQKKMGSRKYSPTVDWSRIVTKWRRYFHILHGKLQDLFFNDYREWIALSIGLSFCGIWTPADSTHNNLHAIGP